MQYYEERLNKVKALLKKLDGNGELASGSQETIANACCCPITLQLMEDPVTASDTYTYERSVIMRHIAENLAPTSPMTKQPLIMFGTPLSYIQPNRSLRDVIAGILEQRKEQIKVVIVECLDYIELLNKETVEYIPLLVQELLRGILRASPGHKQASSQLNIFLNNTIEKEYSALLAIVGGTFMRLHKNPPNEMPLLTLFSHYLALMVGSNNQLLTLQPVEKKAIQRILPLFEQWLTDLTDIQSIANISAPDEKWEKIVQHANNLHKKIQLQNDFLMISSGLSHVNLWLTGTHRSMISNEYYAGPSAGVAIIHRDEENVAQRQWTQIDSFSPYHQSSRTLTKAKRSVALEIKEIPLKKITPLLLEELMTLKVVMPENNEDNCYRPEHLYETILARLEGTAVYKDKPDYLFKTSRENSFCSSWYVIKDAFYYLLMQLEPTLGKALYKKIICDFQWDLLKRMGGIYKQLPIDSKQIQPYGYLLNEMCAKVASDAVKLDDIKRKIVIDEIDTIHSVMKNREDELLRNRHLERTFKGIYQEKPSFKTPASSNPIDLLRNSQFRLNLVHEDVTVDATLKPRFAFPVFAYDEGNTDTRGAYAKLKSLYNNIETFLKIPNLTYRLHYTQQISLAIETLILSLLNKGLEHWFDDYLALSHKVAPWLLQMGQLYYSATCRIAYEHQSNNTDYNPVHYGKLFVITHSIYAMLDVLARKDAIIGSVLKNYQLNTELNQDLSFNTQWKELMLPDKQWVRVLGELKRYFDRQQAQRKANDADNLITALPQLFSHGAITGYYDFTFKLDADEQNSNIQCALALLEKYPQNYEKFQRDFQSLSIEKRGEKWAALFFGKSSAKEEYLPVLFSCLRNIAYYAHVAIHGMSEMQMGIVKAQCESIGNAQHNYITPGVKHWIRESGEVWGYQSLYSASGYLQITPCSHKPTQYVFPEKKRAFQELMYPSFLDEDQQNLGKEATENYYISNYKNRPELLSPPHYITLSFIRTNLHIKLSRLYMAIKNNILSLDAEENVYLMKQALFEVGEITWNENNTLHPLSFLERRLNNARFATIFIQCFIDLVLQAQEKLSQHRLLGHMLEILIYLHSFSPDAVQETIHQCLVAIRTSLISKTNNETSSEQRGILSAYVILTYQTQKALTQEDVELIFKARELIEENTNALINLPAELYSTTMHVLLTQRSKIETTLNITSSLYQQGDNMLDIVRGRRYINNVRVGGLSKNIIEHADYQAAFDNTFLLYNTGTRSENKKQLVQYTSRDAHIHHAHSLFRRVTLLDAEMEQLWLEEKEGNGAYYTFVPHSYLVDILPHGLIEGYTHWVHKDKIEIKNKWRDIEFTMNLKDGMITSLKYKQPIIPFHKVSENTSPINDIFRGNLMAFEDSHYILLLTNASSVANNNASVVTIVLPRFHLSFSIKGNQILSNDYKDYRLAPSQQIDALLGISNYLVIESVNPLAQASARLQRKVIIGHRNASRENTAFYTTEFQLDLASKPYDPSYFTYHMDETLGALCAETTAGKLYLAWLFFKTASLARDPLTLLNGYEMAAELLKNCWQNTTYDALELEIILRFLDVNHEELKKWRNESKQADWDPDDAEMNSHLEKYFVLRKEQHRNAIAILLRVLFLLNESLETHFLHKKAHIIQLNDNSDSERKFYLKSYGPRYFMYYLNVKNRVHEKCILSLEEERKFLKACRVRFDKKHHEHELLKKSERVPEWCKHRYWPIILEDYLNGVEQILSVEENNTLAIAPPIPVAGKEIKYYQALLHEFTRKNKLQLVTFEQNIQKAFLAHYQSSVYTTAPLPKLNYFSDWFNFSFDFDMKHFIAVYQLALSGSMTKERFESMLNVIAVKKREWWLGNDMRAESSQAQRNHMNDMVKRYEENSAHRLNEFYLLGLQILYIAINRPSDFQSTPAFLFSSSGELNQNQSFGLMVANRTISKNEFINILGETDEAKLVRDSLWKSFEQHFLEHDLIKYAVSDIESSTFLNTLQTAWMRGFAENNAASLVGIAKQLILACLEKLKACYLIKAKNKEVFTFFMNIAKKCDTIKTSFNLGTSIGKIQGTNQPIVTLDQLVAKPSVSFTLNQADKLPEPVFFEIDEPKVKFSDWFSSTLALPRQDSFPLKVQTLNDSAIFSEGFGDAFMKELKQSYDQHLTISEKSYRLTSSKTIDKLADELTKKAIQLKQLTEALWRELHLKLIKIPETPHGFTLALSRHAGQRLFYTKSDTLKAMMNSQQAVIGLKALFHENPFLTDHASMIFARLRQYIHYELQRMQWEKTLDLIAQYQSIVEPEEKSLLEQEIAKNLAYQSSDANTKSITELLFELENGLIIRDNQRALTQAMMNSVQNYSTTQIGELFQLNMGEGKTSVILILLVQALADGNRLVRINVLEALMGMMKDLLAIKFGGLIQKRVYHMPFSRDVEVTLDNLQKITEALTECRKYGHILLMTPEHRLCLQLKQQEKMLEYVQFKEADNLFNWRKYQEHVNSDAKWRTENRHFYHSSSSSLSCFSQDNGMYSCAEMKEILVEAKYIDANDVILLEPDVSLNQFWKIIENIPPVKAFYKRGAHDAYYILTKQTISRKEMIQKQSEMLTQIEHVDFCDILDESDEILRYGNELNYTLGEPVALDAKELRWAVPSMILSILFFDPEMKAFLLQNKGFIVWQEDSTYKHLDGKSPILRFTDKKGFDDTLKSFIANKLLIKIAESQQVDSSRLIRDYLDYVLGKLAETGNEENNVFNGLKAEINLKLKPLILLAKGWLSHEILFHVMSRRYRVEFGLDAPPEHMPTNTIAIPYKGMNNPSPRSEFSHPDVMLGLTMLSYYYQGLHAEQLRATLLALKTHVRRDEILNQWLGWRRAFVQITGNNSSNSNTNTNTIDYPLFLRSFNALDLDNPEHLKQATRYLGKNAQVINYYLDKIVFPDKAKSYKEKITGNAHTLAGASNTTGFSGTDDRKDTLPATVKSIAPEAYTNGKMIHLMTRQSNKDYRIIDSSSVMEFLNEIAKYTVEKTHCCALIDSGAMTAGMNNREVAQFLFERMNLVHKQQRFQGIVFFDDTSGRVLVTMQGQQIVPLATCHIDKKALFFYLDDIHTRGSDFKLPLNAQGIVTLCRGMNKDKLMQAMMRLRQLNDKQSVCFRGPKEVTMQIMQVTKESAENITSEHVLAWVIYNTIQKISGDLYPVTLQKLQYVIKRRALHYQEANLHQPIEALTKRFVESPPDSLEEHYVKSPTMQTDVGGILDIRKGRLQHAFTKNLDKELPTVDRFSKNEKERKKDTDADKKEMGRILFEVDSKLPGYVFEDADLEADQEKEKETEREKEAEPSPPENRTPEREGKWQASSIFDAQFVQKSREIAADRKQYPQLLPLEQSLMSTKFIQSTEGAKQIQWPENILVTNSFIQTVIELQNDQDAYLRPADAILVHKMSEATYFILLSGCEANDIRALYDRSQWLNNQVFLVHLNDMTNAMVVPLENRTNIFNNAEERYIRTVLRLFNGECYFEPYEEIFLNQALGIVTPSSFINDAVDEEESVRIYRELESRQYLQSRGFFSPKLTRSIEIGEDLGCRLSVKEELQSIQEKSTGTCKENSLAKMPSFFKQIVIVRGNAPSYLNSTLGRKLGDI